MSEFMLLIAVLCLILCNYVFSAPLQNTRVIETTNGPVQGVVDGNVDIFRGMMILHTSL